MISQNSREINFGPWRRSSSTIKKCRISSQSYCPLHTLCYWRCYYTFAGIRGWTHRCLQMRRLQCCFIISLSSFYLFIFLFLFARRPLQDQFYLRNANAASHQEKQCHILIKRSWHEQTATMTINKLLASKIKLCQQRILRIAYQMRCKQSVLGTN